MSLANLLNQPCTITLRTASGEPDRAGVPRDEVTILDGVGYFEQRQATEQTAGQSSDEQRWLAMVLPTATTDGSDPEEVELVEHLSARWAIEPDGLGEFEVVGAPWPVRNPRLRQITHLEAEMRRVTSG